MSEAAVRERFVALAVDIAEPMTPEQFAALMKTDFAKYGNIIRTANIKPDS